MKKKVITVSSVVVGILLIGWLGVGVLLPRVIIYAMIKEHMPDPDKKTEYFTDLSIAGKDVQTVDNGCFSVKIPSGYTHITNDLEKMPYLYKSPDGEEYVMLYDNAVDLSRMNLLDPQNFKDMAKVSGDMGLTEIAKGFEELGNGMPNSAYNTYKCALLTERDDYSFLNIRKGVCFSIAAVLRSLTVSEYDEVYLYENGDKRGIIFLTHPHNGEMTEKVRFMLFRADDLNTNYIIMISARSSEDAFAVINSTEFI